MPSSRHVASLASLLAHLAAFAALPVWAAGDPAEVARPALRLFRAAEGLTDNTVYALALGRDGRLWAGTRDGLLCYDGAAWQEVTLPGGSRTRTVRALLAARDGSLWVGTQSGGVVRLHGDARDLFDAATGALAADRVSALAERETASGQSEIWVATQGGGISIWSGGGWRRIGIEAGLPSLSVWAMSEQAQVEGRRLWVGTEGGLARERADGRFEQIAGLPKVSFNSFATTRAEGGSPRLWVGSYGAGLFRRDGDGPWQPHRCEPALGSDFVTAVAGDEPTKPDGALWVATDGGGLVRVDGDRCEILGPSRGLPSSALYSLLRTEAREGADALWIGTRNGGLVRLTESRWRSLQPAIGGVELPVTAILMTGERSAAPRLWLGTDGGGLRLLEGGRWRELPGERGHQPGETVLSLLATSEPGGAETVWVGTRNSGLWRLEGQRWRQFDHASGALPHDIVYSLLEERGEDGQERLWAGTRAGLALYSGGRWRSPPTRGTAPSGAVYALAATTTGRGQPVLWAATSEGLARLRGGSWRHWRRAEGLPNEDVQALHVSRAPRGRPTLWIGTAGGGVALLDLDDEGQPLALLNRQAHDNLVSDFIYSIVEDERGRIYLVHNRGVTRLTARPDAPAGEAAFDAFHFTYEDGLPSNQGNRGAAWVDGRGRVWVGTASGAALLDPATERPDATPKRLLLSAFALAGAERRPLSSGTRLSHRENHLEVEYRLLSYFAERATRYRVQLEGHDREPGEWSARNRADFSALATGDYTFRVWGRDGAGNVSGPLELAFTVAPAPWASGWARLVIAALVAAAVFAYLRFRLGRQKRRERELAAIVEARTRQLREAHDLLISLSYVDPLTSVANRRRFDEVLDEEWRRAVRARAPLALVLVDIDHFKAYNDTYGHPRGDECLRQVARALDDSLLRAGDLVGRYGGEEFGVILPQTDLAGAVLCAEQLRAKVERLGLENSAALAKQVVTISCGAAALTPQVGSEPRDLVLRADVALYRAKQRGRNRVETPDPDSGSTLALG